MEELLREAACLGNLDAVQTLLQKGACINSQHSINGWTALHWACKRGHVDIVQHLLQNGADVDLLSCKSESVADVTSDDRILKLLQAKSVELTPAQSTAKADLTFVPNYLKYPSFPYYDVQKSLKKLPHVQTVSSMDSPISHSSETHTLSSTSDSLCTEMKTLRLLKCRDGVESVSSSNQAGCEPRQNFPMQGSHRVPSTTHPSLLVKVRVCGSGECDFVEVEVGPVTYSALLTACCEELEVAAANVAKIRKLPNILVRKDRDVQRMKDGQELEVVLKNENTVPTTATHLNS